MKLQFCIRANVVAAGVWCHNRLMPLSWNHVAPALRLKVATFSFGVPRPRWQRNHLLGPTSCVAEGATGQFVVTDSNNNCIKVFSANGIWLRQWGSLGVAAGKFSNPRGVACIANEVFVADRNNHRVQVFDPEGTFLRMWTGAPDFWPEGMAVATHASMVGLLVVNAGKQICWFGSTGMLLRSWGEGLPNLDFAVDLADACMLPDGNVCVTDYNNDCIYVFHWNGALLRTWGSRDPSVDRCCFPRGVAVYRQEILLVANAGSHRLQAFRLADGISLCAWENVLFPHSVVVTRTAQIILVLDLIGIQMFH